MREGVDKNFKPYVCSLTVLFSGCATAVLSQVNVYT